MLIELKTAEEYRSFVSAAEARLLLKHSTRCGISAGALDRCRAYLSGHPGVPAAMVKVVENRLLSRHIAEETGIPHQTPQLLLFRHGKVVFHASHGGITAETIDRALEQTRNPAETDE